MFVRAGPRTRARVSLRGRARGTRHPPHAPRLDRVGVKAKLATDEVGKALRRVEVATEGGQV